MSRSSAIIVKGSPATQGKRTYIVFGDMRGGTTMIGGVMRALGFFMGENVNEDNQESFQFNGPTKEQMRESIRQNNAKHNVWGWKYPHAADYLDALWDDIRNPHLICVFRDGVANARGLNRWHPVGKVQALQQTMLRQQQNLNLVSLRNCPSMLISYEKAERHKAGFLEEFAELLGTKPDHDRFDFRGFMAAESYKKMQHYVIPEPQPEPVVEAPVEPKPEPAVEAPVEPKPEPAVEAPVEPKPEPAVEAPVEPKPEPAVEAPVEPKPEPVVEAPVESQPEPAVEAPVEPQPEPQSEPVVENEVPAEAAETVSQEAETDAKTSEE